jgi:hypothetical protein
MKIHVLPVDARLQPESQPFLYPAHNADYGVEQDFHRWILDHPEYVTSDAAAADFHYLPVYWTRWHLNHDYGKQGRDELAALVDPAIADDRRTFTICQNDDGPLAPLGETTVFLASRQDERGRDIPLLSSPHVLPRIPVRRGRYRASFVGRVHTHPIRAELAEALAGRRDVRILDGDHGTRKFVRVTRASLIALAPRGYGGSSFRFFEAAQLGAVPMLVGDIDTRPFKGILDWPSASLYAPDAASAARLIDEADPHELARMGERAERLWREDLTYGRWCGHVLTELER